MGIYLSSPITTKDVENDAHCRYPYGAAAMQGWRRSQEDAHNCLPEFDPTTQTGLFAVYDGHGGAEVANYCQRHLPAAITSAINSRKDVGEALMSAFLLTDAKLIDSEVVEELQTLGAVSSLMTVPPQGARRGARCTAESLQSQPQPPPAQKENDATSPPGRRLAAAKKPRTPLALSEFLKTARIYRGSSGLVVDFDADDDDEPPPQRDENEATVLTENAVAPLSLDDDDGPSQPKTSTPLKSTTQPARLAGSEPPVAAPQHVPGYDSGCTACVVLVRGAAGEIVVANTGDSRCVLSCDGGRAVDLSFDHKPQDPVELQRIRLAGGTLTFGNRINGGLNVSRCIGDHNYKSRNLPQQCQMVTAMPDIVTRALTSDCEFLVVACDGIWNSMSSQAVIDFIRERLIKKAYVKLSDICCQLFDACLSPTPGGSEGGCDNMTCLIILLGPEFRQHVHNKESAADNERPLSPEIEGQEYQVNDAACSSTTRPAREDEQLLKVYAESGFRSVGMESESDPLERNAEPPVTSHLNYCFSIAPERPDDFASLAAVKEKSADGPTGATGLEGGQNGNLLTLDHSSARTDATLLGVQNLMDDRWLLQGATVPSSFDSQMSVNEDSLQMEMQRLRGAPTLLTAEDSAEPVLPSVAPAETIKTDVTADASALSSTLETFQVHVGSQPDLIPNLPESLSCRSEVLRQGAVNQQTDAPAVAAEPLNEMQQESAELHRNFSDPAKEDEDQSKR